MSQFQFVLSTETIASETIHAAKLTDLLSAILNVLKSLESDIRFTPNDFEDLRNSIERAALHSPAADALVAATFKHPDFWRLRLIAAESELAQQYGIDGYGQPVDPDEVDPSDDGDYVLNEQQFEVLKPLLEERGWLAA
jgi:hypothetical protein